MTAGTQSISLEVNGRTVRLTIDDPAMPLFSQFYGPEGVAGKVKLVAADLAGMPHETVMSPGGIINGTAVPYTFPSVKTLAHRLVETPLRPSWIRAPGRMQSAFANEAFFDEIAVATNTDPFEMRLRYLANDERAVEVLQRLSRLANWQNLSAHKPVGGGTAAGRGMAFVKYENNRTYVGMVATVEIVRATGVITAKHFAVVQDCGQIINPDGVKNRVTSIDWQTYPILTFPDVPEVDIDLIDRPNEKPWGAGEPSSAIVSAAISNAVFDGIGVRLRSVPFTPQKALPAMQS
jgi:nicotinate dehydrogenase subunit B